MSQRTDTERLDFIEKWNLAVSANCFGEWQVFENVSTRYRDGCVTRNCFSTTARDAIDTAMDSSLYDPLNLDEWDGVPQS